MAGACKVIGTVLVALGLVAAVLAGGALRRHADSYNHAALAAQLNAGNVMYEAELGKAQITRAFELTGLCIGVLLALNGATLFGLGVVTGRLPVSNPR